MDFSVPLANPQKMKQPVNWWQIIAIIVPVMTTVIASWITHSNKLSAQEIRIQRLEADSYNYQLKIEKSLDKLEAKIDNLNSHYTKILVELQNKANRN